MMKMFKSQTAFAMTSLLRQSICISNQFHQEVIHPFDAQAGPRRRGLHRFWMFRVGLGSVGVGSSVL
ncbi:hypothetical protein L1987_49815 [Smallanthus sonchifolius]|uniref:Uncharacterized protein n=1 Tax=Smallanthus sonchifolius TaxID=185202 RepID=A0ACB9FVJ7_9ASTR|nr:hypothetical protein L1987_49815 [Smallanthus sonchifolius]